MQGTVRECTAQKEMCQPMHRLTSTETQRWLPDSDAKFHHTVQYGEILRHCAALYRIPRQVPESKCITFPYMNNATVFKRPGILKIIAIMTSCQQPVCSVLL